LTVTTIGCGPAGTELGITKFNWTTPTRPAGYYEPDECGCSADSHETGSTGAGRLPTAVVEAGAKPEKICGDTSPAPVKNRVPVPPGAMAAEEGLFLCCPLEFQVKRAHLNRETGDQSVVIDTDHRWTRSHFVGNLNINLFERDVKQVGGIPIHHDGDASAFCGSALLVSV